MVCIFGWGELVRQFGQREPHLHDNFNGEEYSKKELQDTL